MNWIHIESVFLQKPSIIYFDRKMQRLLKANVVPINNIFMCNIRSVTLIIGTLEGCIVYSVSTVTCLLSIMSPKTCSSKYDKNILINTQKQSLSDTLAVLIRLDPTVFSKWYCVGVEMCPLIMKHYTSGNLFLLLMETNILNGNFLCNSIFIGRLVISV